ncbi:MAG: hypothetical protein EXS00_04450 [Phycisphaerales bacterium]|nr:hypothetical protein [Phycisphaerales bacterium]
MPTTRAAATITLSTILTLSALAFSSELVSPTVVNGTSASPIINTLEAHSPGVSFSESSGRITRVYGVPFGSGSSPVDTANRFVTQHSGMFGVPAKHLVPIGPFDDSRHIQPVKWNDESGSYEFMLVAFTQQVEGIPVFRSQLKLLVRNEAGFPLVLAAADLRDLGGFADSVRGKALPPSRLDSRVYAKGALAQFRDAPAITSPQMVIFAGTDNESVAPRLAVSFIIERGVAGIDLQKLLYVADVESGEVLFEEDQICYNVTGVVSGMATVGPAADACGLETSTPLPYVSVTGPNGSSFANSLGQFDATAIGTETVSLSASVGGQYFVTYNQSGSNESLTTDAPGNGTASFLFNAANSSEQSRAAVNAYLHSNVVRDFTLAYNPNYPTIAGQTSFPVNVNLASTCNAYYNGTSINFYSSGGGCNNTAFSSVVHHEYGHHLVAVAGSGQGAYGEGLGDVMGLLITENTSVGIGFQSCSSGIRDANNTCMYSASGCSTCGSEIHACGQLLSGCVWDVRQYLYGAGVPNFRDVLANLAVNSILLHTGSLINADITIDWLTLDDNDGNLSNGSPHFAQINSGFSAHGLPGPMISPLSFTFPGGLPALVSPAGNTTISMQVATNGSTPVAGTGKLYWRVGGTGAYAVVNMTQTVSNSYTVQIPATTCGSALQYYFTSNSNGGVVASPLTAPTLVYAASSATGVETLVSDYCETSGGWVVGASDDAATTGIWVNADPVATSAQPGDDHTAAGTNCWITGQHVSGGAGSNDIDGGITTLTSPTYNMAGQSGADLSFWLWYSNNTGGGAAADVLPIEISNNGGTTWVALETIPTDGSTNAWVKKTYRVSNFVAPTASVRFRVRAQDFGSGSLVEAAIDDVEITGLQCSAPSIPGDLDGDGLVNGTDMAILLGAFGSSAGGDINGDGVTDGVDLAIQVANWS